MPGPVVMAMHQRRCRQSVRLVEMHVMILNEEVPIPEEFKSGIPSVDLHLSKQKGQHSHLMELVDLATSIYSSTPTRAKALQVLSRIQHHTHYK